MSEMGSFATIIAILVIGTLSTISAQNELSATEQPSKGDLRVLTRDSYEDSIDRELKTRCDENGGSDAFQVAKNASSVFRACQQEILNSVGRLVVENDKDHHRMVEFFKKYCSRSSDLGKCLTDFDASVAPCMTDEERSNQMIAQNMTKTVYTLFCENEASLMIRFVRAGGDECVGRNADLEKCTNSRGEYSTMVDRHVSMVPWPRLNSTRDCRLFSEAQNCVIAALRTCASPTPSTIAAFVMNKLNLVTPCGIRPTDEVPNSNDD